MAESTRELKLKLTIDAPDPSKPSKAFQDIAAQANKLSEAAKDAQKHILRMQGPAGMAAATGGGDSTISWSRPGFAGSSSSISWSRPGFTGAPGGGLASTPSLASVTPLATALVSPVAASAIHGHRPPVTSTVPAFDRPQAVVIVGPKPLPVTMIGGPGIAGATSGGVGIVGAKSPTAAKGPSTFDAITSGLGKAAGVAAGIAVAASAFGTITEAAAKMNDPLATSADRMQTLARAVPVFGDSLASIVGSVTSAVGRLRDWEGSLKRDREMQQHPLVMARQQIEFERREKSDAISRRSRDAGDAVAARQKNPSVAYEMDEKLKGASGLSGLLARGAWENKDERLKGAMEAVRDAERALSQSQNGLAGAKADAIMAGGEAANANAKADAARRAREDADKRAGVGAKPGEGGFSFKGAAKGLIFGAAGSVVGGYGGVGGTSKAIDQASQGQAQRRALQQEEQAITAQQEALRRKQAAEERLGQKSLEIAQKQYELEKKRIELQKTRVELLQEEYQRTQNVARTFGAMTSVEQEGVLADLKRFKEGGREALTEGSFSRLANVLPEFVGKQLEDKTKDSPLLKQLLEQTGMRDAETIQKELKPLKAELTVKAEFNERQYLDATKKAADEMTARLLPLIDAIAKAAGAITENRWKQQNRG